MTPLPQLSRIDRSSGCELSLLRAIPFAIGRDTTYLSIRYHPNTIDGIRMAKKSRRTKQSRSDQVTEDRNSVNGFDYGCLPRVMTVSALEFPGQLSSASVVGVAYGSTWSETLAGIVPTLSLIAENEAPLVTAFRTFNAWSQATDPDSLELTIVFRETGGYLLAIGPEQLRLRTRCLGYDRSHEAKTSMSCLWVKPIDTVHPLLRDFQVYCRSPIAPFIFSADLSHGRLGPIDATGTVPPFSRIEEVEPLIKFEITIVDEQNVKPETSAWVALQLHDLEDIMKEKSHSELEYDPKEIAQNRTNALRCHFGVTLERIRRDSTISTVMRSLKSDTIRCWQVEQALCNLILSADLTGRPHFPGNTSEEVETKVVQALTDRYELADNSHFSPTLSPDIVETQILADSRILLSKLNHSIPERVSAVWSALEDAGVADAKCSIDHGRDIVS